MVATVMWDETRSGILRAPAVLRVTEAGATDDHRLADYLPWMGSLSDDVIITRQGDVMASCEIGGVDHITADGAEIEAAIAGLSRAVDQFGAQFGWYVTRLSIPERIELPAVAGGFAGTVDASWQDHLRREGLRRRITMLTLVRRPDTLSRLPILARAVRREAAAGTHEAVARLQEGMRFLEAIFGSVGFRRLTISGGDWLGYLARAMGREFGKVVAGRGQYLSALVGSMDMTFRGRSFTLEERGRVRYGAIFGVKAYPARTGPRMLSKLDLPAELVVSQSFTPYGANAMEQKIRLTARQMRAVDDAAASLREQLVEAADDVASGRASFGRHHLSVMVLAPTEAELEQAASAVWQVGQDTGATFVQEGFAARAQYFAQAPGNWGYRPRATIVSNRNFADMVGLFGVARGRAPDESPWGETISVFPTIAGGAYRLNFHEAGRRDEEPSPGHALVLGRTGSGKTLLMAFLMAQARRADARLVVIDKDRGLEMAVRALGGRYSAVRVGEGTGLNPFRTETDARGEGWLLDWLGDLLGRQGALTAQQAAALRVAVGEIVKAPEALRSWDGLASLVAPTDDGGELLARVNEWTRGGRYGWLFGEAAGGTIDIGEDVAGIDMTEVLDTEAERTALLGYFLRRVERVIEDRRPTLIVIDEAWKMLNDESFERRLHDWLVTFRKKNAVVVMLTQLPGHLRESRAGQAIVESVATQILFPNRRASPGDYALLRVTEAEAGVLTADALGRRVALCRSGGDSVVLNVDLAGLGALTTVLGGGEAGAARVGARWRDDAQFWRRVLE